MPAELKPDHVKYLCLHCSASRWGNAEEIDKWHKARGWSQIGYHNVILNGYRTYDLKYEPLIDGKIEPGRPENLVGAHCEAAGRNYDSLGICLIGIPGIDNYPTSAQYGALVWWLAKKCIKYNLSPWNAITQHSVWDKGKPFCASVKLLALKTRVALKIREIKKEP